MDSVAGIVRKIWEIKPPQKVRRRDQSEAEAEAEFQQSLKKYQEEQAAGITRKIAVFVPQDYKADGEKLEEFRIYEAKIHRDETTKVGDRILVSGDKYELNNKLGFQKNPKIEILVSAKK